MPQLYLDMPDGPFAGGQASVAPIVCSAMDTYFALAAPVGLIFFCSRN